MLHPLLHSRTYRIRLSSYTVLVVALLAMWSLLATAPLQAQMPPPLTSNISPCCGFTTIANIQDSFNNARRQEETQLGAAANSIANLTLPANWDTLSDEEKAFFLVNDARTSRAGVTYSDRTVIGLPLQMMESHLQQLIVNHNQDMIDNNFWSHTGSDGRGPFTRMDDDATLGGTCDEFMIVGENLYVGVGGSHDRLVETAVFTWIYQSNGHRQAILIQNQDYNGNTGFGMDNNFGDANSEGFMAFDHDL
ncbi:MAG: hypothetical protein RhofKO_16190 [Rhodothermales bacterium]